MFAREKPLPSPVLRPDSPQNAAIEGTGGIVLGSVRWNPELLPNGHIVAIGASGSGKTQTLKAIAYALHQTYPTVQVMLIDFHGDQEIQGEVCHAMHMSSPWGINPLVVNLDQEGGGPKLQSIQVATLLKKALQLGPNQEGLLLDVLGECYRKAGIRQEQSHTWEEAPPNFSDVETELAQRAEDREVPCKDSQKLHLKLAATFTYGIFSRPQPELAAKLIRIDLSKLPPELAAIAAESLARQLMNHHRLQGEIQGKLPRTFLFIDEAKEMPRVSGSACDRIIADGRKYGLALVLASQSERHLSLDVIGNSATKLVLPVDQTEVRKVAKKFRFAESKVAQLLPLTALCRFGNDARFVEIIPYYQRIKDAH
jgi:energy-coupling factor transporter ATP-binding protein EcfA2